MFRKAFQPAANTVTAPASDGSLTGDLMAKTPGCGPSCSVPGAYGNDDPEAHTCSTGAASLDDDLSQHGIRLGILQQSVDDAGNLLYGADNQPVYDRVASLNDINYWRLHGDVSQKQWANDETDKRKQIIELKHVEEMNRLLNDYLGQDGLPKYPPGSVLNKWDIEDWQRADPAIGKYYQDVRKEVERYSLLVKKASREDVAPAEEANQRPLSALQRRLRALVNGQG